MATATKKTEVTYTLTLTEEEAQTIFDVLYCGVIGSSEYSRRGIADQISVELRKAGLTPDSSDMDGYIEFR